MFAKNSVAHALVKIISTSSIERSDEGMSPVPIVLITSLLPKSDPRNIPTAQRESATVRKRSAPEPYAIPIEAAEPLAPIFIAKHKAIIYAKTLNMFYH